MSNLKYIITEKFKAFCKHCTLHGVYYFSEDARWWLHGCWLMILTASLMLCCYLSHMIWEKFAIDPTLTVVESTHYSTANILFPAVTICDTEVVYGPKTDNISQLLSLRGYNKSQITDFFESFTQMRIKDYSPESYVPRMHFLLEDLGYPLLSLLYMFKKPCEELLTECTWRSQPQDCRVMFRPVYTIEGYCCQFDISYFRKNVDEKTNFVAGMQTTEALDININSKKTSDKDSDNGYVTMYVFDEQENITFTNNPILLTPGALFDVNVYLWAIDSSSYVKALSLDQRQCVLDTDLGARSYQGCLSRLLMRNVVQQCKCLPFHFTASDFDLDVFDTCNWERFRLHVSNTSRSKYAPIESPIEIWKAQADIRTIMSQNKCYQKCDYAQYETEVEFVKIQRMISETDSKRRVLVHYSASTCMKYRREVLYTWDQMLANFGGIFGLCLGGSLISVIEIIWFTADLIITVVKSIIAQNINQPRKKKALKKWNAKVFALNQENQNKFSKKAHFKFTH